MALSRAEHLHQDQTVPSHYKIHALKKKIKKTHIDNVIESEERNPGPVPFSGSVPTFYGVCSGLRHVLHQSIQVFVAIRPTSQQTNKQM